MTHNISKLGVRKLPSQVQLCSQLSRFVGDCGDLTEDAHHSHRCLHRYHPRSSRHVLPRLLRLHKRCKGAKNVRSLLLLLLSSIRKLIIIININVDRKKACRGSMDGRRGVEMSIMESHCIGNRNFVGTTQGSEYRRAAQPWQPINECA
jgi:hypothetical protein